MYKDTDIRSEVEDIIKSHDLDRTRIYEVSKLKWHDITEKTEKSFLKKGCTLHWSNINNDFKDDLKNRSVYIGNNRLWFHQLKKHIPENKPFYVFLEGRKAYEPKYWLYEMCINELMTVLEKSYTLMDFYIVSKKFDWLLSEDHEEYLHIIGEQNDCK